MEHPTPQRILASLVNEFATCIPMLLDTGHNSLALVLLYSGIDAFASLARPESELDTNGDYFKKWAEDYMIGPSQLSIGSEDLWGARCGLLHTHAASSKVSPQGKARQLHYYRARALTPECSRNSKPSLSPSRPSENYRWISMPYMPLSTRESVVSWRTSSEIQSLRSG